MLLMKELHKIKLRIRKLLVRKLLSIRVRFIKLLLVRKLMGVGLRRKKGRLVTRLLSIRARRENIMPPGHALGSRMSSERDLRNRLVDRIRRWWDGLSHGVGLRSGKGLLVLYQVQFPLVKVVIVLPSFQPVCRVLLSRLRCGPLPLHV